MSFQSCLTLCNPVDYSPPDSSVHGILQARILECIAIPSSTILYLGINPSLRRNLDFQTVFLLGQLQECFKPRKQDCISQPSEFHALLQSSTDSMRSFQGNSPLLMKQIFAWTFFEETDFQFHKNSVKMQLLIQ